MAPRGGAACARWNISGWRRRDTPSQTIHVGAAATRPLEPADDPRGSRGGAASARRNLRLAAVRRALSDHGRRDSAAGRIFAPRRPRTSRPAANDPRGHRGHAATLGDGSTRCSATARRDVRGATFSAPVGAMNVSTPGASFLFASSLASQTPVYSLPCVPPTTTSLGGLFAARLNARRAKTAMANDLRIRDAACVRCRGRALHRCAARLDPNLAPSANRESDEQFAVFAALRACRRALPKFERHPIAYTSTGRLWTASSLKIRPRWRDSIAGSNGRGGRHPEAVGALFCDINIKARFVLKARKACR